MGDVAWAVNGIASPDRIRLFLLSICRRWELEGNGARSLTFVRM